jgi:hypothetical protein
VYVRDLALELRRRGHAVAVFAAVPGPPAEELMAAGIPVTSRVRSLPFEPEVIHGHHFVQTLTAVRSFPGAPAIFVCHDHTYRMDRAPLHARVRRHFGVSLACVQRLCRDGVPREAARLLLNFVDLRRFEPRPRLPPRPRRALVFSNYAHAETHLPAVREACRRAGLELDVIGERAGTSVDRPERVLGQYDLVFAKGKAAMEALAVGAAVVLCDTSGAGPMVTAAEFDSLRPLNFGFLALRNPLEPHYLLGQIARYDADDAASVRDLLRNEADLEKAVELLVRVYGEVIAEQRRSPSSEPLPLGTRLALARDEVGARLTARRWAFGAWRRRRGLTLRRWIRR